MKKLAEKSIELYIMEEMFLDVLLVNNLLFSLLSINKIRSVTSFIKRRQREFADPHTTKRLYVTLVRLALEYTSVIWSPFYQCNLK